MRPFSESSFQDLSFKIIFKSCTSIFGSIVSFENIVLISDNDSLQGFMPINIIGNKAVSIPPLFIWRLFRLAGTHIETNWFTA